jgi:hypothetical protein
MKEKFGRRLPSNIRQWLDDHPDNELTLGEQENKRGLIENLRNDYKDDPYALGQLDKFDPNSEYTKKFSELREARRAATEEGDMTKWEELVRWFKNYEKIHGLS